MRSILIATLLVPALSATISGAQSNSANNNGGNGNNGGNNSGSQSGGAMIAWWRFDEGHGIVAHDSSGSGLHGILMSVTGDPRSRWRADGHEGWSLDFTDGYWVSVPNDVPLALADSLSISAWVSVSYPGESSYMRIVSKKSSPDASAGYEFEYNLSTGALDLLGGGADLARAENVHLGDGAWHHVVATADGTVAHLYVDGVDRTTDGRIGRITADATRFEIGRRTGTLFTWWHRSIDDVRMFDYALSPAEVRTLAGVGGNSAGSNNNQTVDNGPKGNG